MARNPFDLVAALPRTVGSLPRIARALPRLSPDLTRLPEGRMVRLADDVQTRLYDTGERDLPPVVLLHGMAATGILNWYQTFQRLTGEFRLITYDQRRHGRGPQTGPVRFSELRDDVFRVMDHLELEKPVLAGYSMGGFIAQLAARAEPDRLSGIVLAATGTGAEHGSAERMGLTGLLRVSAPLAPAVVADVSPDDTPYVDDPSENVYLWAMRELASVPASASREVLSEVVRFDSAPWLHEVEVPAAVIKTLRDLAFPQRVQDQMADLLPRSATFPIDGGHAVCATHPGVFARRVRTAVTWVRSNQ